VNVERRDVSENWTCEQSADLYGLRGWGGGYFDVSPAGEVSVNLRSDSHEIKASLVDVVAGLKDRGLALPVLLRLSDILGARISQLNETFREAIDEEGYKGEYRGAYPIKVNQQQEVVHEVAQFGRRYHHGLEAGSKAELIAALAYLEDPEAFIVCNGYKDEEFVDLALYGLKMGLQTILVLETPDELDLILHEAQRIGVRPRMGVRVKLSARGGGRWTNSGGDHSVFGLSTAQIVAVLDELGRRDMLDCLQMLHYHLGSQIPNIGDIRQAIAEASRFYADLVREGAPMGILDIGGGLAVDYDGSQTDFASSRNYDLKEYCADVIDGIRAVADEAGVPHPTIISESGRAVISYHSVLLVNVLDASRLDSAGGPEELPEGAPERLQDLLEVSQTLTPESLQERYHDAVYYRDQLRSSFLHGGITMRQRAMAERIFWNVAAQVAHRVRSMPHVPEELRGLNDALADIYYGNFSVFQSLPDAWAIEHLFPIMPIHRLTERPSRMGRIADITCDCDGRIDKFIGSQGVKRALPLHELRADEDYILGIFLVGAYQETLGDLHNLFGDTNVVSIRVDADGELEYSSEIHGDSVADVLSYVEYEPKALVDRVRKLAEKAVRAKRISPMERREILGAYEGGLRGYTYFES